MNNHLIRIHTTGVVVYTEATNGTLLNELGRFFSLEFAAISFRNHSEPLFVEDCLFGMSATIRRYRIEWPNSTNQMELHPCNNAARRSQTYTPETAAARFFQTIDDGCVFISEQAKFQPAHINLACTKPGNHPHRGTEGSTELAIKPDMSDPNE